MQSVVIHTKVADERLWVSLDAWQELAQPKECELDSNGFNHLVDSLRSLKRLEPHLCASEMAGIGQQFAKLLGPEFLLQLEAILLNRPITIRIVCDCQAANLLPWDLLELPTPLGLAPGVSLIRIMSADETPNPPEKVGLTLGLFAAAGPSMAYGSLLSPQSELLAIAKIFPHSRFIKPIYHPTPTKDLIRRAATHRELDIFHFMGHGDLGRVRGLIQLSDGPVFADELPQLVNEASRLVVLSACDTAGDQRSVGNHLARAGVSAVIGMQCQISDTGARIFSRAFYLSISQGNSIEEAFHDARLSMQGMGRDWFAPILMRSGISEPMTLVKKEDHNFPLLTNRFVGREAEFRKVVTQLTADDCRLVTMTGMGGIGKTTLAHRIGIELAGIMPDGAFLIECDAVTTQSDLVATTAAALSIQGIGNLEDDLFTYLKNRTIMLVFDCFERITALSKFLKSLLGQCSGIKILVTSRIILGIPGEHEFRVPPLSHRRRKDAQSEAVELFVSTAIQYSPDFVLTSSNRALVQSLVQDLEGVPLAILLAASRLRHFSLADLAERIQTNRLETLRRRAGPHDRHADLYRVIGDSLDLLDESDRKLLGILTVFVGGFFLEDAQFVVQGNGDAETISWLRDNSLLSASIEGNRMRYRMLDTIREYLLQSPYTHNLEDFRLRHSTVFSQRAQELTSLSGSSRWTMIVQAYPVEAANFRQAVSFALSVTNRELMRAFVLSLARIWLEIGRPDEFNLVLPFVEQHFADDIAVTLEVSGLEGELAKREKDYERSKRCWRKRADICRDANKFEEYADSLLDLADLGVIAKDFKFSVEMLNEFDQIDPERISRTTLASGFVLHALCSEDAKTDYAARAESLLSSHSPDQSHLYVQMKLALIYQRQNNIESALKLTKRTIEQALQTSHLHSAGNALRQLADLYLLLGDHRQATLAVFAGCRIPSGVSAPLRRDFRNLASQCQSLEQSQFFEQWNVDHARTDWTEIAMILAKS